MTEAELYALLHRQWLAAGWPWWVKPFDLNLFGVRSASDIPDGWDDVIGVAYVDDGGTPRVRRWVATTDPGRHYLRAPMTPLGTIVVEPGYHRGLWAVGTHTGYPALQQVGTLTYRRDNDRDDTIDRDDPLVVGTGNAVNLHHGGGAAVVGRVSAGCQAVRMPSALTQLLGLVELQRLHGHGTRVSYGLVDVREVPAMAPVLLLGA